MKHILLISLAALLASCSYQQLGKEAPEANSIAKGEKFRINLPEEHSSGYLWLLSNSYDTKVLGYEKSVWHGPEKGVDFNFEASATGKTELVFYSIKYRDTAAVKHFIIDVR